MAADVVGALAQAAKRRILASTRSGSQRRSKTR